MATRFIPVLLGVIVAGLSACTNDPSQQLARTAAASAIEESTSPHPLAARANEFETYGRYDSALVYFDRARRDFEADENWTGVVHYFVEMGRCALELGLYDEATAHLGNALTTGRRHLGDGHPAVGEVYIYQGRLHASLSEYERAFDTYRKALDLLLGTLGEEHVLVATLYHNLAGAYRATGDFKRSTAYFEKAMRIRLERLGEQHPDVARTYDGLAALYAREGDYEIAVEAAQKALSINTSAFGDAHPEVAKNLQNLGDTYRLQGAYNLAFDALNRGYEIAFATFGEQHPSVALLLNNLGIVYVETGDYVRAIAEYERSLRISTTLYGVQHRDVAVTRNNLGWVYTLTADYDRAVDMLQSSRQINTALFGATHFNVAISLQCLGTTYRLRGEYKQAFEALQKSLDIALAAVGEHHLQVATILNDLGVVYVVAGDPMRAVYYYNRSLKISRAISGEMHIEVAATYNNLGNAYRALGDYDRAIEMLQNARRIKQVILGVTHPRIATSLNNLGHVFSDKGEHQQARRYLKQSLDIFISAYGEMHPYVANQYNSLGAVTTKLGAPQEALEYYKEALRITRSTSGEKNSYVAGGYRALGTTYEALGDSRLALEFYKKALSLWSANYGTSHPMVAESYNYIGELYYKENAFEQALASFEKAMCANVPNDPCRDISGGPVSVKVLSEPDYLASLWGKARTLTAIAEMVGGDPSRLTEALSTYLKAVKSIDRMRRSIVTDGAKLHWSKMAAPLLADAIGVALHLYEITNDDDYKATAFFFAEKGKATLLLESFSEVSARQIAGLPDSLLEQERRLSAEMTVHEQRLREIPQGEHEMLSEERNRRQQQIFELKRSREGLISHLEEAYPDYFDLKYNVEVATAERVQRHGLDDQTAVVEYVLGKRNIFIFTLTSTSINATTVAKDALLDRHISELRRGIIEQDYQTYTTNAHVLFRQLLEPVIASIPVTNLIVVPDGVLNYVPFEALLIRDPAGSVPMKDYRRLPYLIERFAISYSYSSTLRLETIERKRPEPPLDYLAFAPVFKDGVSVGSGGADLLEVNGKIDTVKESSRLAYLPRTFAEVTAIRKLFLRRRSFFERLISRKSKVYLNEEATESNFKTSALDKYRYVHFATHGFANQTTPAASGVVLFPEAGSSSSDDSDVAAVGEDGVLRLDEVYNLRLNADLVVLSACETGLGPLIQGEGILSLTRGFLYAGASNVLVSLWKAADAQTGELMPSFYGYMLDGTSKSAALRWAKLAMIRSNPRYARPFYWAPFVLVGE